MYCTYNIIEENFVKVKEAILLKLFETFDLPIDLAWILTIVSTARWTSW